MTLDIPVIETERLILRGARWEDFDAYAAFRADPVQTKFLGGPFEPSRAFGQLGELIGHWHLRGYGRWMITDRADGALLGVAGPYFPVGWPEPEIAWSVFAGAEGRGIAFEAASAARDYAYKALGWTTAISLIGEDNTRSIKLAERLGASREGRFVAPVGGGVPSNIWRHPAPEAVA